MKKDTFSNESQTTSSDGSMPDKNSGSSTQLISSKVNILTLPDEMLEIAIELAALEHEPGFGALKLSHVCQRFRRIALRLPKIWSRISYKWHNYETAYLYAQRGQRAGLGVTLNDTNSSRACVLILKATAPFSYAWRRFAFTEHVFHNSESPKCLKELRAPLRLPRLEEFTVWGSASDNYVLYSMPNLKFAHFFNAAPSYSFSTGITKLSLTINEDVAELAMKLVDFLKRTPSVTDLSMAFRSPIDVLEGLVLFEGDDATLPNITRLGLYIDYGDDIEDDWDEDNSSLLQDFLLHLKLPELAHLSLEVVFGADTPLNPPEAWVFGLLPDPATHTKLASLDLKVHHESGRDIRDSKSGQQQVLEDFPWYLPLALHTDRAPFLTNIKVTTNFNFSLTYDEGRPFFRCLRRLIVDNCPRLTNKFMNDVYLGLKRDGNWDDFEELVVRDCPKIDLQDGSLDAVAIKKKMRLEQACIGHDAAEVKQDRFSPF